MKLKFLWEVLKGFIESIWRVILVFIVIVLYAVAIMSTAMLAIDNQFLLLLMNIGLYLIPCFGAYIFVNREDIKEQYRLAKEKDSGQVIERSYTLFIKVRDDDSYTKKEVKIDTVGKTDIEIHNELKEKVFEHLSWGYQEDIDTGDRMDIDWRREL